MPQPRKIVREEAVTARITDNKTLSALDFINDNAPRKFNMSDAVRDGVQVAAADLGWVYNPADSADEI